MFIAFRAAQASSSAALLSDIAPPPSPTSTPTASETTGAVAQPLLDQTSEADVAGASAAYAEQMIWQLNQYRAEKNLLPLKVNPALMQAAQDYAARLALGNFFGHYDPDFNCNRPSDRAAAAGYTQWNMIGENLAAGYPTSESALDALKRSAGHNAAMLSADFREVGIGYYYEQNDAANVRQNGACPYTDIGGPYRYYWVQMFGARSNNGVPVFPVVINGEAVSTTQRVVDLHIHGVVGGKTWAQQMRFSEDNVNWSPYEPYNPHRPFLLSPGTGLKTVYVQLMSDGIVQTSSDSIYLVDNGELASPMSPRAFVPVVNHVAAPE
ncbi:MAG: CAP domain-containing protein [Anaerolineae bacterium]|nr:CAP domain-containing protein [Candidatus Roseilinea sp.]MDW8451818.1 CAP domain-containing protein [Anaerolineae bacterium]